MPSVRFEHALDAQQLAWLQALGQAADAHGAKLWAVGGIVRDSLLGRPVLDIDLTSETPADELGHAPVSTLGGSVSPITPFMTVKLTIDGHRFDLATTRTETYPHPATLPIVTPSTLSEDLKRRDFTINAMAASLAPADFGDMTDPHGGQADLDARLIRALHQRSFRDDPTRAFRAVRYAVRLGFRIDRRTAGWMRHDAPLIESLSGTRIRHEIERMLDEPRGATALLETHRRGLLAQIHPALGASVVTLALRSAARANLTGLELLAALMYPLSTSDVLALTRRLSLSNQQAAVAEATARAHGVESQLSGAPPSVVDRTIGNAPAATLTAIASVSADSAVRASVRRYTRRAAHVQRHLDGKALAHLGVPSGPRIGEALAALRSAELDNLVRTRRGATHFIKQWLQEI
jgi:tRNA nucleotidyltransferase (CCA-adding enzyme)